MKTILMNKNKEVLVANYNEKIYTFDEIIEIKDIGYAPYILNVCYKNNKDKLLEKLNEWYKERGIPSWRDNLDMLLHRLNIESTSELLDKAYALSLSDQYYIKPYNIDIKYDDINFFDNDFNGEGFLEASLSSNNKINEDALKTPNNTTDGMLKKAWIVDGRTRYLIKGGYKNDVIEPFSEVLASEICDRLGFNHVDYKLDVYNNVVVSKCPCFINKNTELIPAYQIMQGIDTDNYYEAYISELEKHGIKDVREKLENMYILDYLIMNEDRHLNNFGIIRDVNTLKWIDTAPIFDNGESLKIEDYEDDEIVINGQGRFFYEILPFNDIIKNVRNLKRIDLNELNGIVDWFNNLLHKYKDITNMSDRRINILCTLLERQIDKLKKMQ